VKELAGIIGGGGGGRSDIAEAGGKDPSRLDEALRAGRDAVADARAATHETDVRATAVLRSLWPSCPQSRRAAVLLDKDGQMVVTNTPSRRT
jgi:hypothetical protein